MRRVIVVVLLFVTTCAQAQTTRDVEENYTVRVTMRILNPVNPGAINTEYQTGRVIRQTDRWTEMEFVLFPLITPEEVVGNPNWRADDAGMKEDFAPGVTCNWDVTMRKDLPVSLKRDGIDVERLDDKTVVERVSRWLLNRNKYIDTMFDTWYVDFSGEEPKVLSGLEKAFEDGKGYPGWSVREQFEHELFGRQMYANRTVGSCTSYGILQATVLKALGIPTRIVEITPIVDANDPDQIEMVRKGITHHRVRQIELDSMPGQGFSNHTLNEVYVGKRWVRLNYSKLNPPVMDPHAMGLTVQTNVLRDWSEGNYAATWGKRYGLQEHDEVTKTWNPYRAITLSDHFGSKAKIDNPEVTGAKVATVTKAYWKGDSLMLRVEPEPFDSDRHKLKSFLRQAPHEMRLVNGNSSIRAEATDGSSTDPSHGIFDVYVNVEKTEREKMRENVDYELKLPELKDGVGWVAKETIRVRRSS